MSKDAKQCVMAIIKCPAWVSFLWFGMTAGISMLATPVMFSATSASKAEVLDVSRVVFVALNKVEFLALIILLILVRVSAMAREYLLPVGALALILISQSVWLLPELGARVDLIIAGTEPGPSMAHTVYSALEITKLLVLIYLGFKSLQVLTIGQQFRE